MKITRVEPLLLVGEMNAQRQYLCVRVHTDEGIVGLGEVGFTPKALALIAYLSDLNHQLIGRNPHDIEAIWQYLYRQPYERGGPIILSAIAGIDMALWDILGKSLGVPSYRLWGGPTRDRVPVFASLNLSRDIEENLDSVRGVVARGFRALRVPLSDYLVGLPVRQLAREISKQIEKIRETVGDEIDLAIDIHRRCRVHEALAVCHALEPFGLLFVEDPIMAENMDALAEIARRTTIPIATGENLYTPYQFRDLFAKRAVRFARIDLCLAGGISAGLKIAHLAEMEFIHVIPHHPWGPVATAAYAHFSASIHNLEILEYNMETVPGASVIVNQPVTFKDGYLEVPQTPGLGIELNEEYVKHSAARFSGPDAQTINQNPVLYRRDGTLTDW